MYLFLHPVIIHNFFFRYIMGEEGYCLTSIETAIGYLVSQGMAE